MAKFKFNIESDILNRFETRRYLLKLKADYLYILIFYIEMHL